MIRTVQPAQLVPAEVATIATCTATGVDTAAGSDDWTVLFPYLYQANGRKRPVIVFTGGPGDDRDFIVTAASGAHVPPVLATAGWPLYSAEFGGTNLWGNPTTVTRIGQAWTKVKALMDTAVDQFIGIGVSKGATALLNYAKDNPADVAGLALFIPAVDIQDMHTNDRAGSAASIAAAYGGGAPPDSSNPADNTGALDAIPQEIWRSTNDTACVQSVVDSYATAVSATVHSLGAAGHSAASVSAAEVAAFLAAIA